MLWSIAMMTSHRPSRLLVLAAAILLCAHIPALSAEGVDPAYKKAAGPYKVALVSEIQLKDPRRQEATPIRIRAPRPAEGDKATFPLVIFSHGAGGSSEAFPDLCAHWANHGYIVVNPTHSDSVKRLRESGQKLDPALGARQVVDRVNLLDRCADVRLILDSFAQIEKALADAGAPVRIDPERIALAGHSAGAMTTQTLAGVRFFGARAGAAGIRMAEPRIKAFLVISGQGLTRPAFRKESWKEIAAPMLVMAGSRDVSPVSDETPESRRDPFEYASPGDKYLVYIDGATHGSYAGKQTSRILRERAPDNPDYITDIVAFSTTAFLDACLRADPAARAYLASDALVRYPGGKTEFKRK